MMSRSEDDPRELFGDPDLEESVKLFNSFTETLRDLLKVLYEILDLLNEAKQSIEEGHYKHHAAKVAGVSASIVGGILLITGFGLSFVTFGASLGLTIAGGTVAALGSTTQMGAVIGYGVTSKNALKEFQWKVKSYWKLIAQADKQGTKLAKMLTSLKDKHPTVSVETVWALLKAARCAKATFSNGFHAGHAAVSLANATQSGVVAWKTLSTGVRCLSAISVGLNGVFIVTDVIQLVHSSSHIHRRRTTGQTLSATAENVGKLIAVFEEQRDQLSKLFDEEQAVLNKRYSIVDAVGQQESI